MIQQAATVFFLDLTCFGDIKLLRGKINLDVYLFNLKDKIDK